MHCPLRIAGMGTQGITGVVRELARLPNEDNTLPRSILATALGIFYILLGLAVGVQLLIIIYQGHDLRSFQAGFLSICFLWAGVRAVLLLFPMQPTAYSFFLEWLPSTLEFATFSMLAMFCQYLTVERHSWQKLRLIWQAVIFLAVAAMLASTFVLGLCEVQLGFQVAMRGHVLVTGIFFGGLAVILAHCAYKLHKSEQSSTLQPLFAYGRNRNRHRTVERMTYIACGLVVLFAIRSVCDLVVSSGAARYGFLDESRSFVAFHKRPVVVFLTLVLWEIVPALALVASFWQVPEQPSVVHRLPMFDGTTMSSDSMYSQCTQSGGGVYPGSMIGGTNSEKDPKNESICICEVVQVDPPLVELGTSLHASPTNRTVGSYGTRFGYTMDASPPSFLSYGSFGRFAGGNRQVASTAGAGGLFDDAYRYDTDEEASVHARNTPRLVRILAGRKDVSVSGTTGAASEMESQSTVDSHRADSGLKGASTTTEASR